MEHKIFERCSIGNPHRPWRQDNFVLSNFSMNCDSIRDAVKLCRDAGFTMVELGWSPHDRAWEAVKLCEEYGLNLLFQDFANVGGMQERNLDRDPAVSVNDMKKLCSALAPYRRTVGLYVWDEPYVHDQLVEARRQMDMYQTFAPDKLAFVVAIPSYNTKYTWDNGLFAGYLEDYAVTTDPSVLSLDYYPYGLGKYNDADELDASLFWCDLGLLRRVAAAHNMPMWFYYQGVNLHKYAHFEFPMVRCQMYAAALYGAKGLQLFTGLNCVFDEKGGKGRFFDEMKEIHAEFAVLGNTLMALDSEAVYHSSDLLPGCEHHAGLTDSAADSPLFSGELPARTSAGLLADKYGNRYVMFQNRALTEDRELTFSFRSPLRFYEVSRADGKQSLKADGDRLTLSLAAGDAALMRIQDIIEPPFTLEYRLTK